MIPNFINLNLIICIFQFILWNIQHSTASITFNISDIPKHWNTCGHDSSCEGITQFCDEDLRCRYCNEDVCKSDHVPPQCYIKCLDLAQKDVKVISKTTQISPTINNKDLTKPGDFYPLVLVIILLSISTILNVVLLGVIFRPIFPRHVKICAEKNTQCMERQKTGETDKFINIPENNHTLVADRNNKTAVVASGMKYVEEARVTNAQEDV